MKKVNNVSDVKAMNDLCFGVFNNQRGLMRFTRK